MWDLWCVNKSPMGSVYDIFFDLHNNPMKQLLFRPHFSNPKRGQCVFHSVIWAQALESCLGPNRLDISGVSSRSFILIWFQFPPPQNADRNLLSWHRSFLGETRRAHSAPRAASGRGSGVLPLGWLCLQPPCRVTAQGHWWASTWGRSCCTACQRSPKGDWTVTVTHVVTWAMFQNFLGCRGSHQDNET